ncbi:hypothetical protein BDZ94DRAFT_1251864 [Collybia nuda]|uniref:Uncharacterized protein n=1 Tax=Collybia nuda TaxID=64659 RepID=A0A9P6CHN5_9AGAR|nr:hypothetical protein BDZ94DRAFT_1251864 [Collybia nuda]
MSESHHRRTTSNDSKASYPPPSPPSLTYHSSILPRSVPTPALVESVAGAAHYSGIRIEPEAQLKRRRSSHGEREVHSELKADHSRVLADLKELYCCRPTLEILDRLWRKDAIFEDPLSKCKGFDEYAAQWFAMPKLFSHSETTSSRVMSSTHTPNRLVFSQTQTYTTRFFKRKKAIESIIIVEMDENEKIIRLVDQWGGNDLPIRFGAQFLRVLNAKITPWLISIPKRPTS